MGIGSLSQSSLAEVHHSMNPRAHRETTQTWHVGDVVAWRGEPLYEEGPDGYSYVVAWAGDLGTVCLIEPYSGFFRELLAWPRRQPLHVSLLVDFPRARFGAVDCPTDRVSRVDDGHGPHHRVPPGASADVAAQTHVDMEGLVEWIGPSVVVEALDGSPVHLVTGTRGRVLDVRPERPVRGTRRWWRGRSDPGARVEIVVDFQDVTISVPSRDLGPVQ